MTIPNPLELAAISPDRSNQTKALFMIDAIKQAINHWEVGNVKIARVIELEYVGFPPGFLFDGLTEDRVKSIAGSTPTMRTPTASFELRFTPTSSSPKVGESSWTRALATTSRVALRTGT